MTHHVVEVLMRGFPVTVSNHLESGPLSFDAVRGRVGVSPEWDFLHGFNLCLIYDMYNACFISAYF